MPFFDLLRKTEIEQSPRVSQLEGIFDVQPSGTQETSWRVETPDRDEDWKIGLIVGPSGSGKSTAANHIYPDCIIDGFEWDQKKAVVDGFPKERGIKEICESLSSVGFNSPPSWIKPYHVLSNGEKFRVTIARALCENKPIVAIDEFTSVVDRTVARIGSSAVSKAIRNSSKKFIAISCHSDIIEWLNPDWILEMPMGTLTRRSLRRRPPIEFRVERCKKDLWQLFKNHHYMNKELYGCSFCFCSYIEDNPVCFIAVKMMPGKESMWSITRMVCMPDYQGCGIGVSTLEYVCSLMSCTKNKIRIATRNPFLVKSLSKRKNWKINTLNKMSKPDGGKMTGMKSRCLDKYVSSFCYVGPTNREDAVLFGVIDQ